MEELVDRESRARYRARLIFAVKLAAVVWLLFWPLDLLGWWFGSGPLWLITAGRFTPLVVAGLFGLDLLRHPDVSRRRMRAYETLAFSVAMAGSTMIYISSGGWGSPRVAGGSLLLMAHAVMLGSRWRHSLVPIVTMTLTLPAVLLLSSAFLPELAAQLSDEAVMKSFFTSYFIVIAAAAISLFGGHGVWKARAEVHEAKSIGRYRLRKRIASGGMGEIWAAYHEGLGRDVALKLVQASLGTDAVAVERFRREVRTLAELTHPNIVRVFDYGATEAGVWYYAMELLEGEDLQRIIESGGSLEIRRALRLLAQAAGALGEAHARGTVHRDVKPANLLVVETVGAAEFVKVIDFGIAEQAGSESLTRTGMVVGTPGFIAPETLGGAEATARSDVYGLGVVLYVALTGVLPHEGDTPQELVLATVGEAAAPPSSHRAEITRELDDLVMRCLSRDPMARFADGGDLARALRRVRTDTPRNPRTA